VCHSHRSQYGLATATAAKPENPENPQLPTVGKHASTRAPQPPERVGNLQLPSIEEAVYFAQYVGTSLAPELPSPGAA
jgi:hypothetical protein